jgi:hypothetical protein
MIAEVEQSLEQELNPWLAAETRFTEAANRLNLDEGLQKVLRTPTREITVAIPVQLDDGRLEGFHRLSRAAFDRARTRQRAAFDSRPTLRSTRYARSRRG